ncbi:helix-turn-helix domain-containing protein [Microvirga tunisiensis]|uniref:Helix-turn-helix domain-containing protein n=1 Tax=Pannonibacter tanglangensis TaxID=2750084 RepID=A0A7X5EZS8_9HYPH|nr:helix-turn-helix transcriptional regulator [Pannonibacter sp. XCT-53]NBN77148.1 helix-turn-helix domain-containing protein [Pannonibacter sp. XCT-53]
MPIHPELYALPDGPVVAPIYGYSAHQAAGSVTRLHCHDAGQLFHVVRGSLAIDTERGTYFVPPERAVWMPARFAHETRYLTQSEVRYLYVQRDAAGALPAEPRILQMTQLLRELILAYMSFARAETAEGPAARIGAVILDQLVLQPAQGLDLPMPAEDRMRRLCERIARDPAAAPPLTEAAESCALSVRSFERRIQAETGLSFRSWCRQARLFRALELLASGCSVSDVAFRLGYEGPSAFVATFRKAFGVTPGRYFEPSLTA